jgi:hypothetical protein
MDGGEGQQGKRSVADIQRIDITHQPYPIAQLNFCWQSHVERGCIGFI